MIEACKRAWACGWLSAALVATACGNGDAGDGETDGETDGSQVSAASASASAGPGASASASATASATVTATYDPYPDSYGSASDTAGDTAGDTGGETEGETEGEPPVGTEGQTDTDPPVDSETEGDAPGPGPGPGPNPNPGDVGDCCSAHAGSGCSVDAIEAKVCQADPTCCSGTWDDICAVWAEVHGGAACPGIPGSGNCCAPTNDAGCNDPTIQACVCTKDVACCQNGWDAVCVAMVAEGCGSC